MDYSLWARAKVTGLLMRAQMAAQDGEGQRTEGARDQLAGRLRCCCGLPRVDGGRIARTARSGVAARRLLGGRL